MQEAGNGYRNGAAQPGLVAAPANEEQTQAVAVGQEIVQQLEEPFDATAVKWVIKATGKQNTRQGVVERGLVLPYVDVRQYADRLNHVLGLGRWIRRYEVQVIEGAERKVRDGQEWKSVRVAKVVVKCEVTLAGLGTQTGLGEGWADDDNAITAAEAQAFKRACSMFGLGRYLYEIEGEWVDLDQNRRPVQLPPLPEWAIPEHQRPKRSSPRATRSSGWKNGNGVYRQELTVELRRLCALVGTGLAASILQNTVRVAEPGKVRDLTKVPQAIERLENASRGVQRLSELVKMAGDDTYAAVCRRLGIGTELDAIPNTSTLRQLIQTLEDGGGAQAAKPAIVQPTIVQLRMRLLQEARRVAANDGRQLDELIAESSGGEVSLQALYKTGERERAALERAVAYLQVVTAGTK